MDFSEFHYHGRIYDLNYLGLNFETDSKTTELDETGSKTKNLALFQMAVVIFLIFHVLHLQSNIIVRSSQQKHHPFRLASNLPQCCFRNTNTAAENHFSIG